MKSKSEMRPESKQQRTSGFSLPVVIFILVVISVLAGAMARLMGGGGLSTAFEVQSTRAYLVARSGLEWAANATLSDSTSPDCPVWNPWPTNSTTIDNFPSQNGLHDCMTIVECERISPNTSPNELQRRDGTCNNDDNFNPTSQNCTLSLFRLTSNATCGTGPAEARRELQWLISKETAN